MSRSALRGGLFAGLLVGALACASAGTDVREYVLTSLDKADPRPASGGRVLAIGPVVLPPYLRRLEIVTRVGANELRASDSDHWGEDLGQGLARVVAENLAVLLPALRVSAFAWRDVGSADYRVSIEVNRFEQMPDGSIALDARWELHGRNDASPVAVRSVSLTEEGAGSGSAALVQAMSRAAARLSQEIALTVPARSTTPRA